MKLKLTIISLFIIASVLSCTDRKEMVRLLEQAEQQNRDYVPFTSDSIAKVLTAYFDSHGTPNLRMLSHYILGCAYRDLGEAPRALQCLNDAAECADTTSADCDFKTLSRVYGQMSYIYEMTSSPKDAIEAERMAIKHAYAAMDTLNAVMFEENLLGLYEMTGNEDSIHSITYDVRNKYLNLGHTDYAAACLFTEIVILLRNGENHKAKQLMDIYDAESGLVDEKGDMTRGPEIYYYAKGNYYNNIGMLDSALHFYNKLQSSQDLDCMEASAKGLLSVFNKIGNKDSITKYANLYSHINDSSNFVRASEEAQHQKAVYNYNHSNKKLQIINRKFLFMKEITVWGIVVAVVFILFIVFSYRKKIKKERRDMISKNKQYNELISKYNELIDEQQSSHKNNKHLKALIHTNEEEIAKLKTKILQYQEEIGVLKTNKMEELKMDNPIIQKLHDLASKGKDAPEYLLYEFKTVEENHDPNYFKKVSNPMFELTQKEILVTLFIKDRFLPSETACLMGVTLQRITNIRRTINKKMFNQKGTKSLESNLYRLMCLFCLVFIASY